MFAGFFLGALYVVLVVAFGLLRYQLSFCHIALTVLLGVAAGEVSRFCGVFAVGCKLV